MQIIETIIKNKQKNGTQRQQQQTKQDYYVQMTYNGKINTNINRIFKQNGLQLIAHTYNNTLKEFFKQNQPNSISQLFKS